MDTQRRNMLVREASDAEDKGNWEKARKLLQEARTVAPTEAALALSLAQATRNCLAFSDATKIAEEAVRLSNNSRDALLELATNLRRDFQCTKANAVFERILEKDPQDREALSGWALNLCEMEQPTQALEVFDRLLQQQPDEEDYEVGRAGALIKLGRYRDGIAVLRPIVETSPDYVRAQLWVVEALFGLHQYESASRHIAVAYESDAAWSQTHYWAAALGEVSGDQALQRRELQEALRLQPSCYLARVGLGLHLWRQGDTDEAFRELRVAAQAAPWSGVAEAALTDFLLEEKRGEPDMPALVERAEQLPYTRLPYFVGVAYRRHFDNLDESGRLLRLAVDTMPDDVDAWFALGETLMLQAAWYAALTAFNRATELAPEDAEALRGLANAQQNLGDFESAAKSYRAALNLGPEEPESHHGLGMVLLELHEPKAALLHLSRAHEIEPQNADFALSLAEAFEQNGRRQEALRTAEQARELANDKTSAEALIRRLRVRP